MPASANDRTDKSLDQAKRQFQRWRSGCRGPGRIPTELWTLAAQAAATHGLKKTAETLRIDPKRLEQWMQKLDMQDAAAEPPEAHFLELPPLTMTPAAECQLEMEDPAGAKLRICLKGPAVAQAAALVSAIWRTRQ